MIGVYEIRSKRTQEVYVGGSTDIEGRKRAHLRALSEGRHHRYL